MPVIVARLVWWSLLCFLWTGQVRAEVIAVPPLQHRVTDLTQTLSVAQITALTQKMAVLEQTKGSQIALLLVPTTGEDTIEQFGIRVVDQWKLGRKGTADGALLLVAKNDKRVRIEVGRGLEGALPDVIAARIVREVIRPAFKQGDFAGGIDAGIDKIIAVIQGEALPPPTPQDEVDFAASDSKIFGVSPIIWGLLLLGGFIVVKLLSPRVGRVGVGAASVATALAAGTPIGIAALLGVGMVIILSIISSAVFFQILSLFLQNAHSGGGGFSSGGGSSGSSSNDSFSGGGGDFGGGGASGDW